MSVNRCQFVLYYKDGRVEPRLAEPCFACVRDFTPLTKLVYYPVIEGGLTDEQVEWWLTFVRGFLNGLPWTAKLRAFDGVRRIQYTMTGFSANRPHNLLYTTAFRYPDEYPDIVRALYDAKTGLTLDDQFKLFQQMHWDIATGTGRYWELRGLGLEGHSLVHGVGGSDEEPISLDQFKRNLLRPIPGVQFHFARLDDVADRDLERRKHGFSLY